MKPYKLILYALFAGLFSEVTYAQIRVPKFVSDGMVLQRDAEIKIWGWASPKEKITLEFNKKSFKTTATDTGTWQIKLPAQVAGGPHELVLKGKNELHIHDVLFGDVFLCIGQSNMVHQLDIHNITYAKDIETANCLEIRHLFVPTRTNLVGKQSDLTDPVSWKTANPKDVGRFSAVAYFFARNLYQTYKIPIGLINASVGGTPIEAWTSEAGFENFPAIKTIIEKNKDTAAASRASRPSFVNIPRNVPSDLGMVEKWFLPDSKSQHWRPINIPGFWEDHGLKDLNGVVWYRREIVIPKNMTETTAKVHLGRIVDADELYINGVRVGNSTYQYPQRRYTLQPGVLKEGKNFIVVKVSNTAGKGGFVPDKPYMIEANGQTLDLKGTWEYKVGEVYRPRAFGFGGGIVAQNQPTSLYNAMVAPFENLQLKGILWYQGESNTGKPAEYEALQIAQINNLRQNFSNPSLPFLFVQLPNFMDYNYLPSESDWARLRESQLRASKVPNTAMAVAIDLGEWNDIHPDNKKGVGDRLALAARKLIYQESIQASGPIFKHQTIENGKILLEFDHIGQGLTTNDGEKPSEFAIAGFDKKFVWANAQIENNKVVVWSNEVPNPTYVRYAWADNPVNPNLANVDGLPASPFRTDYIELDDKKAWKGKKCAVVLTYDDALNVHLDNAITALDSLSLKGTFYITASSNAATKRIADWRRAAQNGHELGNHTLYHPCDASGPGMSWVKPEYDLSKYTLRRIIDEVRMTNTYLESIDGKKKRTFAFTCGHKKVAEGEFMSSLENDFVAARAVRHEMHPLEQVNLMDVDCYAINGETGDQLIDLVKKAEANGTLLVFLFHGVGGEHSLNVSLEAHRQLLHYLKNNEATIWTAPMIDVAEHVRGLKNTLSNSR
ncbi:MAG: sialate O-acetylesterase [Spirosomataceae bacterium]